MASVKFLGHSSFLIEIGGKTIITDPWLNPKPKESQRRVAPGMALEQIRKADLILISHEHYDHCDPFDIQRLHEKTFAQVLGPEEALAKLTLPERSKMAAYVGDAFNLMGLDITVTQAKHPQSANPVGYVVSDGEKSVYFAGDTYDFYDMTKIQVDTALIPIGGVYTMDIISSIKALKQLRCKFVVPMHYDTFDRIKVNLNDFETKVRKETKAEPVILSPGESFDF